MDELKVARLGARERRAFGPISFYDPLMADGDTPIFTGVQTAEPGYVTEWHSHPYVEMLFVLEGQADVEGRDGAAPTRLAAGDMVAVPAGLVHRFATAGSRRLRLLGIHVNPDRVVDYADGTVPAGGASP